MLTTEDTTGEVDVVEGMGGFVVREGVEKIEGGFAGREEVEKLKGWICWARGVIKLHSVDWLFRRHSDFVY